MVPQGLVLASFHSNNASLCVCVCLHVSCLMLCVCYCHSVKCCESIKRAAHRTSALRGCRLAHTVQDNMKCCGKALEKEACWLSASTELYLLVQHFGLFLVFQCFSILNADKFKWPGQKRSGVSSRGKTTSSCEFKRWGWCYLIFLVLSRKKKKRIFVCIACVYNNKV